jgi:hypothetical protein
MEYEEVRPRLDAYLDAKLPTPNGHFSTSISRPAPSALRNGDAPCRQGFPLIGGRLDLIQRQHRREKALALACRRPDRFRSRCPGSEPA